MLCKVPHRVKDDGLVLYVSAIARAGDHRSLACSSTRLLEAASRSFYTCLTESQSEGLSIRWSITACASAWSRWGEKEFSRYTITPPTLPTDRYYSELWTSEFDTLSPPCQSHSCQSFHQGLVWAMYIHTYIPSPYRAIPDHRLILESHKVRFVSSWEDVSTQAFSFWCPLDDDVSAWAITPCDWCRESVPLDRFPN